MKKIFFASLMLAMIFTACAGKNKEYKTVLSLYQLSNQTVKL